MIKPKTTLRAALSDPKLLGRALPGESWAAWRAILLAAMGEALEHDELEHFRRLTGRGPAFDSAGQRAVLHRWSAWR
jgi:hypothetical protein